LEVDNELGGLGVCEEEMGRRSERGKKGESASALRLFVPVAS
jgi:hypothetical protein